jgi:hypothetical protein
MSNNAILSDKLLSNAGVCSNVSSDCSAEHRIMRTVYEEALRAVISVKPHMHVTKHNRRKLDAVYYSAKQEFTGYPG